MNKQFKVNIQLSCDPDVIEELLDKFVEQADDYEATVENYRYFVPAE